MAVVTRTGRNRAAAEYTAPRWKHSSATPLTAVSAATTTQLPISGCIRHQQQQSSHYASHKATVAEGSKLHEIYGSTEVMVNSFHHQAVKDLGAGLVITARASDGIVEGFEKPDHPYFVAAQWHPERLVEGPHHPEHKPLFQSFVDACRK